MPPKRKSLDHLLSGESSTPSKKKNQFSSNPADDVVVPLIIKYQQRGETEATSLLLINKELRDMEQNTIGRSSLQSFKRERQIQGTKGLKWKEDESWKARALEFLKRFLNIRSGLLGSHLRPHLDMIPRYNLFESCYRDVLRTFVNEHAGENSAAQNPIAIRKMFWVVGKNDRWAFDQHDKLRRFGLRFYVGLEPYSVIPKEYLLQWAVGNLVYDPEEVGYLIVPIEIVDAVQAEICPPHHHCFYLYTSAFQHYYNKAREHLSQEDLHMDWHSVWDVFVKKKTARSMISLMKGTCKPQAYIMEPQGHVDSQSMSENDHIMNQEPFDLERLFLGVKRKIVPDVPNREDDEDGTDLSDDE
ncbi:hypothetical protein BT69DRAFT_1294898 [Atractiella rhizophila]|nr:hypothetical protein BT69DRAFT_1294898 [Atractiella rhizophila]